MADYFYRRKTEDGNASPAPRALLIGLDWLQFQIPICAGGMRDQPIALMRNMRYALSVYQSLKAWRDAQSLSAESLSKFYSANQDLVSFMSDVWALQEERDQKESQ